MAKVVKKAGIPAWQQRKLTSHGSSAERAWLKIHGKLARMDEKPRGTVRRRRP